MEKEGTDNKGKLILALDVSEYDYAIELIDRFRDVIEVFKVGLELYTVAGPAIINENTIYI